MKKILITAAALVNGSVLLAQPTSGGGVTDDELQLNTITTALPFMAITPDSRAGAMGDAGTALSGSSTSVYWNTSMLSFAESSSEISISYTPWLRQLTNDIHLSYLSGYKQLSERHTIGGSLRYFSLGEITFTDNNATVLRNDKPSEFEVAGAYAFRLADKLSIGLNGKFAYSNLTGGLTIPGVDTKPAIAGAADISFTYYNEDAKIGGTDGIYTFATTLNNIGNKVSYSQTGRRDFIPMNIKIANAFTAEFDDYNKMTFALEFQKLLVPSPAIYGDVNGQTQLISGKSSDVGVIAGLIQSFYDAPGTPITDDNGDYVEDGNGGYQVKKGSKLKEELSEINIAYGMEYWYNNILALRGGFFYESPNKGNRKYLNFGVGLKYNMLGIDISYLYAFQRTNPLANTLRFTLRLDLDKLGSKDTSTNP